jgi:hypothetical protein
MDLLVTRVTSLLRTQKRSMNMGLVHSTDDPLQMLQR